MIIIIPTYRRADRQTTLNGLPPAWQKKTVLVCDKQDRRALMQDRTVSKTGCRLQVCPSETIAQKRAWIIQWYAEHAPGEKIIMLDDDLRFCRRDYSRKPTFIAKATHEDIDLMLRLVEKKLEKFAHVGIAARQGNNNLEAQQRKNHGLSTPKELRWWPNYRMIYALGYNTKILMKECKLGRIEHREDMDYTMQLLRKGYPNRVLVEWTVDQLYNSRGGASVDRKIEDSNTDAEKLARLHPGLVKVVERKYKQSVPRKEVVCYWKKAYDWSQKGVPKKIAERAKTKRKFSFALKKHAGLRQLVFTGK